MIELVKVRPALAVLLLAVSAQQISAADRFDDIRAYIRSQMTEQPVPSILGARL